MKTCSAVNTAHCFLLPALQNAKNVVDATAGNGNDSLFLAAHTPPDAVIWCFDIQQTALEHTRLLLENNDLAKKARLLLDSHAHIAEYIKNPIDVAVFNLGYLPGENHTIMTQPDSTVEALILCLKLLKVGGLITVVAYPGHAIGYSEGLAIKEVLSSLPANQFFVGSWVAINQENLPPVLYVIEKTRSEAREGIAPRKN